MPDEEKNDSSRINEMHSFANFLFETPLQDIVEVKRSYEFWFEVMLETDLMDDKEHRKECLRSIRTLRALVDSIKAK